MASSGNSLSVQTRAHRIGLILVPFRVGGLYNLELVLNTGYIVSCLSISARDVLVAIGHLDQ